MSDADYPILTEATVPRYLTQRPKLMALVDPDTAVVREVGDGNLNLVFICRDRGGSSFVVKQSLPYVRAAGPSWPLTADRSHAEMIGLTEAFRASPSTTPRLLDYDSNNHVLAMQDLSAFTVWRTALDNGHIIEDAATDCGRHVARLLFHTGILGLQSEGFRRAVARSTNTAMCGITEDLVFTQPYVDHVNNSFAEELRPRVAVIRSDRRLLHQVAMLKLAFMTRTEALVHGDLHTGSVMVGLGDVRGTKAIDPEFCFYGPIAFDLGILVGNLLFAAIRATCFARDSQLDWLIGLPEQIWAGFEDEFWALWPQRVDRSITDTIAVEWLARIAYDSIGFAGCEVIRRVIGFAKVSDIETLPPVLHAEGAACALDVARDWLAGPRSDWTRQLFAGVPDNIGIIATRRSKVNLYQ